MSSLASDSAALADHIELVVCANSGENFNRRRVQDLVEKHWDADSVQLSYAWDVMMDRSRILGERYPLRVARAYCVKGDGGLIYEAMLALTRSGWQSDASALGKDVETPKVFESIVEDCLSDFFGAGTRSVNFGWPSHVGRPPEFPGAVSWLAKRIGIPVGTAYRQPRRKDGGVDVVVWRTMPDGRPGLPLMLVQATVQSDVQVKARDVDRRMWSGWLATDVEPLVALAIPGTITSTEEWNEISRNSLLLDRVRLVELAPLDHALLNEKCDEIVQVCRSRVLAVMADG